MVSTSFFVKGRLSLKKAALLSIRWCLFPVNHLPLPFRDRQQIFHTPISRAQDQLSHHRQGHRLTLRGSLRDPSSPYTPTSAPGKKVRCFAEFGNNIAQFRERALLQKQPLRKLGGVYADGGDASRVTSLTDNCSPSDDRFLRQPVSLRP
jgi:hypothetical protein